METKKRKDVICFSIDGVKKQQIEQLARKERRSTSQFVQMILEDYLMAQQAV